MGSVVALAPKQPDFLDRDEAIRRIRAALKRRSGKSWSVTGGRGTAYGWITIDAPPARRTWHSRDTGERDDKGYPIYEEYNAPDQPFGHTGPEDRAELARLLGLEKIHCQGHGIPASSDYRAEYVARAEGRTPKKFGEPYWD